MKVRERILIVDDMEINRAILREIFSDSYQIAEAQCGEDALAMLRRDANFCVVLLDLLMPGMSGYELLEKMSAEGLLRSLPVVVVTADGNSEAELQSFDLGACDLIAKPFEPRIVRRRVTNVIDLYSHKNRLEQVVSTQAQKLQESNELMIDALSSMVEYRNWEAGQHIRRIRSFTRALLEAVIQTPYGAQWDQRSVHVISSASSMHDIGKIAIPDAILNKPGPLSPAEFEIMKTHCSKGGEMIRKIAWIDDREYLLYAYEICRYHHERWDGGGYPEGLRAQEIPPCALVVSVADVYDALTSNRVYKAAYSHEEATSMILHGECGLFPKWLMDCFETVQDAFAAAAKRYADAETYPAFHDIL